MKAHATALADAHEPTRAKALAYPRGTKRGEYPNTGGEQREADLASRLEENGATLTLASRSLNRSDLRRRAAPKGNTQQESSKTCPT